MRFFLLGGYAESLLKFRGALISDLISRGVSVHVAAPDAGSGEIGRKLSSLGASVHAVFMRRTAINPVSDIRFFLALCWLFWRIRPDAFMGYTIKPVVYGLLAARLMGVNKRYALITGLGYAFQEQQRGIKAKLVAVVARGLYRAALHGAHHVFFQNPDDQRLFQSLGIVQVGVSSSVVNGSGVDVQHYSESPVPITSISFLMIARFLGAKGVREYAQAAELLKKDFPKLVVRLGGWIDEGPDAISQEELDSWTERGIIENIGRLTDVRVALQQCSVYVLPSYREGTPRTVLEAMAVGRAVITTDVPGCRETVADGVNGFLVPARCANELAAAMRKLVENRALAIAMGKRSRRIAEDKYDVRSVNAEMLRHMEIGA